MTRIVHLFDPVERFVAGTVGEPGERTFFLQARTGNKLISVSLEKAQVSALAERITMMLRDVQKRKPITLITNIARDDLPLETPIDEEFRVGVIGISYESVRELIELNLQAVSETGVAAQEFIDVEEGDELDLLCVFLTLPQAGAFAKRADIVVGAGRSSCPFCGLPIDPRGHLCPRANGYRR